jgi:hypothetical protein
MAGLFPKSSTPKIEQPKPIRMPNESDPETFAAAQRTRENALRRSGRLSTIMTDQTLSASSGQKLGA